MDNIDGKSLDGENTIKKWILPHVRIRLLQERRILFSSEACLNVYTAPSSFSLLLRIDDCLELNTNSLFVMLEKIMQVFVEWSRCLLNECCPVRRLRCVSVPAFLVSSHGTKLLSLEKKWTFEKQLFRCSCIFFLFVSLFSNWIFIEQSKKQLRNAGFSAAHFQRTLSIFDSITFTWCRQAWELTAREKSTMQFPDQFNRVDERRMHEMLIPNPIDDTS